MTVRVELVSIPENFIGRDYRDDVEFRENFQKWINEKWEAKDALLEEWQTGHSERADSEEPRQVLTQW